MAKEVIVTDEGLKKLEDELEELKTVKRKDVQEKLKIARGFGDLSENSEYDEAKNEQAMIESRIIELEAMLKITKVVDESELSTDKVNVGSKVTVHNQSKKVDIEYTIVGSTESDPKNRKISDSSPIGEALLGKKVGDSVEVETPAGITVFKVLKISK